MLSYTAEKMKLIVNHVIYLILKREVVCICYTRLSTRDK